MEGRGSPIYYPFFLKERAVMEYLSIESIFITKLLFNTLNKSSQGGFRVSTMNFTDDLETGKSKVEPIDYQVDFMMNYTVESDEEGEYILDVDFTKFDIKKYIGLTQLADTHGLADSNIDNLKSMIFERLTYEFRNNKDNRIAIA